MDPRRIVEDCGWCGECADVVTVRDHPHSVKPLRPDTHVWSCGRCGRLYEGLWFAQVCCDAERSKPKRMPVRPVGPRKEKQ